MGRSARIVAIVTLVWLAALAAASVASARLPNQPERTWQTNGRVRTILYRGHTVYLGGDFSTVRGPKGQRTATRHNAAAFNTRTGEVLRWNPAPNGTVRGMALSARGTRVYLVGAFTSVRGHTRRHFASVTTVTGQVGPAHAKVNANVNAIRVVKQSGNIILGGDFSHVNGKLRRRLAKIDSHGRLLKWTAGVTQIKHTQCPPQCHPTVLALTLANGGNSLYVGGHFGAVAGVTRTDAAKLATASGKVLDWRPRMSLARQPGTSNRQVHKVYRIVVTSKRVFLCGDFWKVAGTRSPNIAAVGAKHGRDVKGWVSSTDGAAPACVLRNKELLIGGHFTKVGGNRAAVTGVGRMHLAAISAATGKVLPWNPKANSRLGVHALALNGSLIGVGGDFTKIGGVAQQGYAQFRAP